MYLNLLIKSFVDNKKNFEKYYTDCIVQKYLGSCHYGFSDANMTSAIQQITCRVQVF